MVWSIQRRGCKSWRRIAVTDDAASYKMSLRRRRRRQTLHLCSSVSPLRSYLTLPPLLSSHGHGHAHATHGAPTPNNDSSTSTSSSSSYGSADSSLVTLSRHHSEMLSFLPSHYCRQGTARIYQLLDIRLRAWVSSGYMEFSPTCVPTTSCFLFFFLGLFLSSICFFILVLSMQLYKDIMKTGGCGSGWQLSMNGSILVACG